MTLDPSSVADTVADVVRAVPGVADLHPGMFGEVATYLPGRRVVGVRVTDATVDVHVTVSADAPVRPTAAAVRAAVAAALPDHVVDVTVEDVATNPTTVTPSEGVR
ncbi:hypothetical protein [Mycolicibacterium arenosum]|uniref:Asp23/Gls24 family envelope stress response protein n=1 Tax=Mycolicibacterium arenosum TaxID=2952157 RepID=A0ABT1LXU7_9MYCO|nr:hypothetical protein [Mycolicibacterium sp. CAU 1645]MCP9271719.1 hypothetical protein [Mycolicibacterium sp. CAU 1645]